MKYTAESIKCFPIDKEKLDTMVNNYFQGIDKNPAITYHTSRKNAIIKYPKLAIIDEEFIGSDVNNAVEFYVYTKEDLPNGHEAIGCMPEHAVKLTLAELETYLLPETTLAEFTKERREYNSRIKNNEAEWTRYFNKVEV